MGEDLSTRKPKHIVKRTLLALLALLLVGAAAFGGYWYRDQQARDTEGELSSKVNELQQKVSTLEKQTRTDSSAEDEADTFCKVVQPGAAAVENIQAAITTGNTTALEGYMASLVDVIYAASDGLGARTPTQAVGDITSFIGGSTVSWAFNIPASTLSSYGKGSYGEYFPGTAVVGKSSQDRVLSFSFDCGGKISTVFMAMNESDL